MNISQGIVTGTVLSKSETIYWVFLMVTV